MQLDRQLFPLHTVAQFHSAVLAVISAGSCPQTVIIEVSAVQVLRLKINPW